MGRTTVALDLGSATIRAVEYKAPRKGEKLPTITRVVTVPVPHGVIEMGEVKEPDTLATVLKDLWSNNKGLGKDVVLGIANDQVLPRLMNLPWSEAKEFRASLPHEIADSLPIEIDNVTLDYHTLEEFDETDPATGTVTAMKRILLVAAASEMVDTFVDAVRGAGLLPIRIDLNPLAVVRASQPLPATPGQAEAVVDIGADVTTIVVHQQGQPRFVRIVCGISCRAVIHALAREFEWTYEDAEQTLINLGLPDNLPVAAHSFQESVFADAAPAAAPNAPVEHEAQPVINEHVARFIGEIRQTLDFFLSATDDVGSLSRIVLSGGGSQIKGLPQRLASELRTPVMLAAPFEAAALSNKVPIDPNNQGSYATAVGMALGAS